MNARETTLSKIIEGTNQYIVPLYQRPYSWKEKSWKILWDDLIELIERQKTETEKQRPHFMGSIVTIPGRSIPEGVAKYILIDGQQRITTLFVILILLRNIARQNDSKNRLAEEINNTLLVNQYKEDLDYYKLQPTQTDRQTFHQLINQETIDNNNQIAKAYLFFEKELKKRAQQIDIRELKNVIISKLSLVSIVLDDDDNPHLVFESLNAKGERLTEADLIRNYFFMRVHVNEQDTIHNKYWKPMQDQLGESMTEFIRHYLSMQEKRIVNKADVYFSFKESLNKGNTTILEYLQELVKFANYYVRILHPEKEPDQDIKLLFSRLNKLDMTVTYPFLLNCYKDYDERIISIEEFKETLKTMENYIIRRFVCSIPSHEITRTFAPLYSQIRKNNTNFVDGLKKALQTKKYPKDDQFISDIKEVKLYGNERQNKAQLILQSIERAYNHKEQPNLENLSIEHVMPQTLSQWWRDHLEDDHETTHELLLHTLGNLTLTAYNPDLSNKDFLSKKKILSQSHLEMNKYFQNKETWNREDIEQRAEDLSAIVLNIWPYFGDSKDAKAQGTVENLSKKIPKAIKIMGEKKEVTSWRDVLFTTVETICSMEQEKLEIIQEEFPNLIKNKKEECRAPKQLTSGLFLETNKHSGKYIEKYCKKIISICELSPEDWQIEFSDETENQ